MQNFEITKLRAKTVIQFTVQEITFKHLNSHYARFRPPSKSLCCSLGNLTKTPLPIIFSMLT